MSKDFGGPYPYGVYCNKTCLKKNSWQNRHKIGTNINLKLRVILLIKKIYEIVYNKSQKQVSLRNFQEKGKMSRKTSPVYLSEKPVLAFNVMLVHLRIS